MRDLIIGLIIVLLVLMTFNRATVDSRLDKIEQAIVNSQATVASIIAERDAERSR